jgi:hypothetical protein
MKRLKQAIAVLFGLFFLLLAFALLYAALYGDQIKAEVIRQLNRKLTKEVAVERVEFSLLNNFPKASIIFHEVLILDQQDTLLAAGKLFVKCDLFSLYKKEYKIEGLELSDGFVQLKINAKGRRNFDFWENEEETQAGFNLSLNDVRFYNFGFTYADESEDFMLRFRTLNTKAKGDFYQAIYDLSVMGEFEEFYLKQADFTFRPDKPIQLSCNGRVDEDKQQVLIREGKITVAKVGFETSGAVQYEGATALDLIINSPHIDLEALLSVLPYQVRNPLQVYKINGKADISGTIKGSFSGGELPVFSAQFQLSEGSLEHAEKELHFQDLTLAGTFQSAAGGNLNITEFSTRLNNYPLSGNLQLKYLKNAQITFAGQCRANLPFRDVLILTDIKSMEEAEGKINADVEFSGGYHREDSLNLKYLRKMQWSGKADLQQIAFKQSEKIKVEKLNGELVFKEGVLEAKNLTALINQTELQGQVRAYNLLSWLDRSAAQPTELIVRANLSSPFVDLEKIIAPSSATNDNNTPISNEQKPLTLYLTTNLSKLAYKKFILNELQANWLFSGNKILAREIRFKALEGKTSGNLLVQLLPHNEFSLTADASLQGINIKQLFADFENFGQNTLTADNLQGTLNSEVHFQGLWNAEQQLDQSSILADAEVEVLQGELIDFKPIYKLSKYIEVEELEKIRFKRLKNQLHIAAETIYIPRFEINSSAFDLSLEGTHTFSNQVDYKFTVFLDQFLGRKARKPAHTEFGYIADDGLGRSRLFLSMQGDMEDPVIKYDSRQLKQHWKDEIRNEKQTVKQLLKEEFGLFKKDSSLREGPGSKKTDEVPFQIEWEENEESPQDKPQTKPEKEQSKKDKKGKIGKFLDKIAQPNEDEYE